MSRRENGTGTKVYVGDLPRDASDREIERVFKEYGRLRNVWVARNPPGFAFVEFEELADAEEAVRELDGTDICGARARVEIHSGRSRQKPWNRGGGRDGERGGGRDYGDRGGREGGDRDFGQRRMKPFNSTDRCFECGEPGHYAYDCRRRRNGGGGGGGGPPPRHEVRRRSRSREGRRSYSRD